MRLLLDEHYSGVIAEQLRRRGFDVVAVVERSLQAPEPLRRLQDEPLLRAATAEGRALVTENVRDFLPLHRLFLSRGETHAGIILVSHRRFSRERNAAGGLVVALAEFMEQHETLSGDIAWL